PLLASCLLPLHHSSRRLCSLWIHHHHGEPDLPRHLPPNPACLPHPVSAFPSPFPSPAGLGTRCEGHRPANSSLREEKRRKLQALLNPLSGDGPSPPTREPVRQAFSASHPKAALSNKHWRTRQRPSYPATALLACRPGSPSWSFPSWIQSRCWVLDLVASPVQPAQKVQQVAQQQQGKQRQQHLQSAQVNIIRVGLFFSPTAEAPELK
ncbi:unnamed protein product, partial [Urochloa humidicola]